MWGKKTEINFNKKLWMQFTFLSFLFTLLFEVLLFVDFVSVVMDLVRRFEILIYLLANSYWYFAGYWTFVRE